METICMQISENEDVYGLSEEEKIRQALKCIICGNNHVEVEAYDDHYSCLRVEFECIVKLDPTDDSKVLGCGNIVVMHGGTFEDSIEEYKEYMRHKDEVEEKAWKYEELW